MNIKTIIEHYKQGGMIIVTDDDNRENEGDLMISSQAVKAEHISFMAREGRGLICMPIEKDLAERLNLPLMTNQNDCQYGTAFTVSVDARENTTTGISAFDRYQTVQTILNKETSEEDLIRPGHLFPLIAAEGGLAERKGHTEAAVEMGRLVGHEPSGLICEIMGDDGTMLRGDDLLSFSETHNLPILTIAELSDYLKGAKGLATNLPTEYGDFDLYHFKSGISDYSPHLALVHREMDLSGSVTVRLHSECLTGDLFGSLRCDCGEQLKESMRIINREKGVLLYMRQEGRGIGLEQKMAAYRLQDHGEDTVDANILLGFSPDERKYDDAADILKTLRIIEVELLTNNPDKINSLEKRGINVVKRRSLEIGINATNLKYMKTKKDKMDHIIDLKGVY